LQIKHSCPKLKKKQYLEKPLEDTTNATVHKYKYDYYVSVGHTDEAVSLRISGYSNMYVHVNQI